MALNRASNFTTFKSVLASYYQVDTRYVLSKYSAQLFIYVKYHPFWDLFDFILQNGNELFKFLHKFR